jgi:catechol 2,3-dioxygenase-like lactoylglutathione lyase family enzyme
MLTNARVATRLPAQDLERAKAFYAEKLGLEPVGEREGRPRYVCATGEFALFESTGAASGDHTQMGWEVDDIEDTVRDLRASRRRVRGVRPPGLKTFDGITDIAGNFLELLGIGMATAILVDAAIVKPRARRGRR